MTTIKEIAKKLDIQPSSLSRKVTRKGWGKYGVNDPLPDQVVRKILNQKSTADDSRPKLNGQTSASQPVAVKEVRQIPVEKPDSVVDDPVFDLGSWLMMNATVIFLFAVTLLAIQAWIFASLQTRVFALVTSEHHIPFGAIWVAGMLFESAGLLLAAHSDKDDTVWIGSDKVSTRALWITAFFFIQVATDFAFFGLFGTWSNVIGRIIIGLSIPFGVAAYSNLYFKK